jgi:hypothetical protein
MVGRSAPFCFSRILGIQHRNATEETSMNPNIAHGLMLARIAEMHRQARRIDTGRTARTTLIRIRWYVIGLMATAMAFLVGLPAAQGTDVPPPGENSGAASVVIHPAAVGGMAGWQIVLIALSSALLASALTLLAVQVARRATPAQSSHP